MRGPVCCSTLFLWLSSQATLAFMDIMAVTTAIRAIRKAIRAIQAHTQIPARLQAVRACAGEHAFCTGFCIASATTACATTCCRWHKLNGFNSFTSAFARAAEQQAQARKRTQAINISCTAADHCHNPSKLGSSA
eukprot:gb/GFBE01026373.1/.p2 GENE.gb/GFBE01026373.1/~~gb/GFBE01026373.1/.p2  ORF type:complete len:135 (-),score=21.03 gb/GFBE01026373.1/:310-714(-)